MTKDAILKALEAVIDPELHRNIVELDMVRSIEIRDGGVVDVMVSLTTPGCPIRNHFQTGVANAVRALEGVTHVNVSFDVLTDQQKATLQQKLGRGGGLPTGAPAQVANGVCVGSGKGGGGKSTPTVNLGATPAPEGKKAGILDADVWGYRVPRMLRLGDDRVHTRVRADGRWWPFQEFMIVARGAGPVDEVAFDGAAGARLPPEVADALATARAIVIGPSNPIISIGPILAVPGLAEALTASPARVAAVSPLVAGAVLKGPTAAFLAGAGVDVSVAGIAGHYAGIADVLVADAPADALPTRVADVAMPDAAGRRRVAAKALAAAATPPAGQ